MNYFLNNKFQVLVIIIGVILMLMGVTTLTVALNNRARINELHAK